jgi:ABC-2 type transport system permease protein
MAAFLTEARPRTVALFMIGAVVVLHLFAYLATVEISDTSDPRAGWREVALGLAFIVPWIVSQAITNTTRALYTRGDLDLVLGSPLQARSVLLARACAIALESVASIAIFVLPLANVMAYMMGLQWLAIYPTLIACGFFGAGIGLWLTMALFYLFGPRRTRLVGQIVATLVGAGFALGLQVANILPAETLADIKAAFGEGAGGLLDPESLWQLPVRAAAGQLGALGAWCLASGGVFLAAALSLGGMFARGASATTGAESRQASDKRRHRFTKGVAANLRLKEWRLFVRDPWLASQILLQIIYTMPVAVVLWKAQGPNGSISLSVAPALVVVASHVAASLSWLTISSEDAPDFLRTAPVTTRLVEWSKLAAIVLPLAILLGPPLIAMSLVLKKAAWFTAFFCICAATSTALLNLWRHKPARRGDLMRRHQQSKIVGMIEHVLSLLWAVGLVLAGSLSWWALAPIVAAIALLLANRPRAPRSAKAPSAAQPVVA